MNIKRLFDLFIALMLIIILSPIILFSIFFVKFTIGSPIIFSQTRPGLNNKLFNIYKFRTMNNATDENGVLLPDSDRLTKWGLIIRKLSIDELPQLYNVIKGDISLVGPRPLLVEYIDLYNSRQSKRQTVKPGITGWAQINGRNSIEWAEKLELDVWYVENRSFLLDLKILFLTILKVLKSEGVNKEGNVTTTRFEGNKSFGE